MSETNVDEHIMIERAIRKDPLAYRFFVTKYNTYAFSIAVKIVKNSEDAEEVVQDSFIRAFKALRSLNRSAKFSTWLYKIVYNTSLTRIRNKKNLIESSDEVWNETSDLQVPGNMGAFERLVEADQTKLLNQALLALNESENLVIELYYRCENSIAEIETITRWNPSTIKIRLFRARQKFYVELSKILSNEINELL